MIMTNNNKYNSNNNEIMKILLIWAYLIWDKLKLSLI